MSKYNHIHSIAVDSIPKEELAQAMKEWAEGSEDMERLLWACYENGIKTTGCHVSTSPYLGFNYDEHNDRLTSLLDAVLERKDSQVFINPDGGNPLSGPEWFLPSITIGYDNLHEEEAKEICDSLIDSLGQGNKDDNSIFKKIMELLDFLIEKDSCLSFRIRHTKDNKYAFSLESAPISDEVAIYFNQLFKNTNLIEENNPVKDSMRHFWSIESDNLEDFSKKIEEIVTCIVNNYSLEPPTSEDDVYNFNQRARFKRRQFGDDLEGQEKFDDWLKEEDKKLSEVFSSQKNK